MHEEVVLVVCCGRIFRIGLEHTTDFLDADLKPRWHVRVNEDTGAGGVSTYRGIPERFDVRADALAAGARFIGELVEGESQ